MFKLNADGVQIKCRTRPPQFDEIHRGRVRAAASALLFKAMVVEPAKGQPVAGVAERVGGHGTRPWRLIRHYVDEARLYEDCTGVATIGIDETSRRGHRCITVIADLTERNVTCVTPGKDSTTAKRFAGDFMALDGDPDRVRPVTCDMGPGFARGIRGRLPNAAKTIDGFHVVKHANEAVGKVRKAEAGENGLLKRTKCPWPGNESNLTDPRPEVRRDPAKRRSKTARACGMRERLQDIHADSANRTEAEAGSKALRSWMMHSRPEPMRALAGQFRRHWQDILAYFDHPTRTRSFEGLNGIIRHVKTRSRGFRDMDHSGTMIYLTCGELGLNTVTA